MYYAPKTYSYPYYINAELEDSSSTFSRSTGIEADCMFSPPLTQASRVVLAAAVIMVSVFAGFIFTNDIMIKQIGFALTIGIFIDAFLVRMTLVPAVMAIFDRKAWWLPKWLDRILPNLDVEGDKLIAKFNKAK